MGNDAHQYFLDICFFYETGWDGHVFI